MWILAIWVVAVFTAPFVSAATDKVVCYHGSWSAYRNGDGKFTVANIDPNLCTHLIYCFVGINSDASIRIMDSWLDLGAMSNFNKLKTKNTKLKTLIAIGGWNEGSTVFSDVTSSASLRSAFVKNALTFVQNYGFDGFDLDWEYPAQRGGAWSDKANFALLLKEFRTVFDKYGYLVTAAVSATGSSVDTSYDVPALSKYLDFINVMAYDLHGSWDGVTGNNAPLYSSSVDKTSQQKLLNVDASIQGWISRGADPQKLILGTGAYGRTFTLANAANNYVGAAATNGGNAGPYTQEVGNIGYNEICEKIKAGGWTVVWDDQQKVPYAYNGNQWIGYDSPESITLKVKYAKNNNLGGMMIWSVETDDFKGKCGTVNPILKALYNGLSLGGSDDGSNGNGLEIENGGSSSSSTSTTTTTKTTTTTTTAAPTTGVVCTATGYMRDPDDCSKFYYCLKVGTSFTQTTFQCPSGLVFDTTRNVCNYATNVKC